MANTVGINLVLTGDSSGAKRALDDINSSVGKLTQNSKPLAPLIGGGGAPVLNQQPVQRLTQSNANYGLPGGTLLDPYGRPVYSNQQIRPTMTESSYGMNRQAPASLLAADGKKNTEGEQKIVKLTNEIEELTAMMQEVKDSLWDAHDRGDVGEEQKLSSILKNLRETESMVKRQLREEEAEEGKGGGKGKGEKSVGEYMANRLASQIVSGIIGAGETIIGSKKSMASGDYMGSVIQREKGLGQLAGGGAGALIGALGFFLGPIVGMTTMALGQQLGSFFGGLKGDKLEIDNALSERYEAALPAIDMFYQRYGTDIEKKSGGQNAGEGLAWYNRAAQASMGTGKTTDEMIQAAAARGAYGNFTGEQALSGARQDIMWERFTGANLGNIQRLSGTAMRYGGDENAVRTAYAGLTASGMGKGQFDEFLTSMQRIMEDGIEKGFVRGADEIAGNMTLLSKLSGGDALWTGEQGANRLMRMNDAVANATGLKSVEDMLSFGVAAELAGDEKTFKRLTDKEGLGNYVDTMMLLEKGVSKDLLRRQFEAVQEMEPGNSAAQIERFMKMYNLNYTGGRAVYDMMLKSGEWTEADWARAEKDIKGFQKEPGMKSDSQRLQDVLTSIDTQLINIGKGKFDTVKMETLEGIAGDIYSLLEEWYGKRKDTKPNLDALPVAIPEVDTFHDAEKWGGILERLLRSESTIEGRYKALAGVVSEGTGDINPHNPREYWTYRAETEKAMYDGVLTSDELRDLIPVLRALANVLGRGDLFNGKSDLDIRVWLEGGLERGD
ncbi:MAG: hypothetical protein LBB72_01465 [Spirochaetaceae bacterium]|nr:hypothetical protein [Spirochaetaceae bacterium]